VRFDVFTFLCVCGQLNFAAAGGGIVVFILIMNEVGWLVMA
jgi:hypothetical protein